MRWTLAISFFLLTTPAWAQERGPAERQVLVDLAQTLGEAHALRQACSGEDDQFWRQRMARLLETEQPDPALEERLRQTFNAGYGKTHAQYPACNAAAQRAEQDVSRRGQTLAQRLAAASH